MATKSTKKATTKVVPRSNPNTRAAAARRTASKAPAKKATARKRTTAAKAPAKRAPAKRSISTRKAGPVRVTKKAASERKPRGPKFTDEAIQKVAESLWAEGFHSAHSMLLELRRRGEGMNPRRWMPNAHVVVERHGGAERSGGTKRSDADITATCERLWSEGTTSPYAMLTAARNAEEGAMPARFIPLAKAVVEAHGGKPSKARESVEAKSNRIASLKAEAAKVAAWKKAGSKGRRPATPLNDAANADKAKKDAANAKAAVAFRKAQATKTARAPRATKARARK
jgi:hypothetical protein